MECNRRYNYSYRRSCFLTSFSSSYFVTLLSIVCSIINLHLITIHSFLPIRINTSRSTNTKPIHTASHHTYSSVHRHSKNYYLKTKLRNSKIMISKTITNNCQHQHKKVAIIGSGAAGLVTARIFQKNGIEPTIFEKEQVLGGVWSYQPNSKDKPMYRGLRTNLPREIMAFREKPWGYNEQNKSQYFEKKDSMDFIQNRSFVTHEEVHNYLKEYATDYKLEKFVKYGCKVSQLKVLPFESSSNSSEIQPKIYLEWLTNHQTEHSSSTPASISTNNVTTDSDTFDAVCVCNGHYASPSIPHIPGMNEYFHGKVIHSVEYDSPEDYQNLTVLCIGGRASGSDLAREISFHAKKVYLSDTTCPIVYDDDENDDDEKRCSKPISEGNVVWVPKTTHVDESSCIHFDHACSDSPNDVDVVIFCSGYDYSFPFINKYSNLELQFIPGERRVSPLYEQMWHATYTNIAFMGLQHSVIPFPFFELQAEAFVHQLLVNDDKNNNTEKDCMNSNRLTMLPGLEERIVAAEKDASSGGPKSPGRVQDTHYLGSYQWDYCLRYAKYAGYHDNNNDSDASPLNKSMSQLKKYIATNKAIYDHSGNERKGLFPGGPDKYRYNCYIRNDEEQSFHVVRLNEDIGLDEKNLSDKASVETSSL